MFDCWCYELYMWIEWLIVIDNEFICQKFIYVDMLCCCEKLMNNEIVVCWIWMDSWSIVVDDVVKTCCWWIGVMIMPYGELMMKVVVVVE